MGMRPQSTCWQGSTEYLVSACTLGCASRNSATAIAFSECLSILKARVFKLRCSRNASNGDYKDDPNLIILHLAYNRTKYRVPCCCPAVSASGVIERPVHGCHRIQLRPLGQCDQQGTWCWNKCIDWSHQHGHSYWVSMSEPHTSTINVKLCQ